MSKSYPNTLKELFIDFIISKGGGGKYEYHPDSKKFLIHQIKLYNKPLVLVAILILVLTAITLPLPYFMGLIIDKVFIEKDISKFIKYASYFTILILLSIMLNFLQDLILIKLNQDITSNIQSNVIKKILSFSTDQFNKFHSAYLISRVNEAAPISIFIVRNIVANFSEIFRIIGCFGFLSIFNLKLTIIVFLTIPLEFIVLLKSLRLTKEKNNLFYEAQAKYQGLLHDRISNMELVRLYSNENYESKRILCEFNKFLFEDLKLQLTNSISSMFNSTISNLQQILLLVFGGLEIINGNLTVGQYFSFIYYLKILMSPIRSISNFTKGLQSAKISASRIVNILNQSSEDINREGIKPIKLKGHIKFENVFFGYFDEFSEKREYVLNDLSFEIFPGQKVHLRGSSGCGKSTVVNLIAGLYHPQFGKIYIDNRNINDYNLTTLRKRIGIVTQNASFFNDTIFNNIKYGDLAKTNSELIELTKKTCSYNFIRNIPDQFDSMILERGKNFSGGQRQRLSISRMLIKYPDILIFDEFDNHLDHETYTEIWRNISDLVREKTVIFITHKEPIIKIDNIIDLDIKINKPEFKDEHFDFHKQNNLNVI